MMSKDKLIRPTQVDRDVYIAFGNRCREDGKDIGVVLTSLIELYNNKGDGCFK
jgi:hypothetical protein